MRRYALMASLLLLLAACGGPVRTPVIEQATPALSASATSTLEVETKEPDLSLFAYDTNEPVSITENEILQRAGYTVHDISYPSPQGGEVPGYLVVPERPGPFAGILLMHGSSGSRETLLPFAEELVHTGAMVLTLSAPAARIPGKPWISFTPRDRDEQIQLMVDLRRAVDLLTQHEKVDASRIGYIGYSYGAAMGGLLAGIEPRIKAYGLMVGDGGLVNHFMDENEPVGGFETIDPESRRLWLEAMEPIEPINFVGQTAPSALFFQNARHDNSVSEEDALAYQAAGSEPKKIKWYDSGHGLPTQAFVDMVHWLAEQIGIDAGKYRLSQ
ncbi:MAG TPA: hypothetical protein VFY26_14150 [Anaerolineales bacterium]|nr:hypothetical protein [Anaerolineales bacterium]